MPTNENARYAREQVELLAEYVRDHWENTDWSFIRLHTAHLLTHVDDVLRAQVEVPKPR